MKNNYFIIHGSYGKPFENWFPWLEDKLSNKGFDVYVPQFPCGNELQNYTNWEKILSSYLEIGIINENTIFIGHSLAPVFVIKFILEHNIRVAGIVSVSGFNDFIGIEAFDKVNKTFFVDYERLKDIKRHVGFIKCIYGDNDPYVPQAKLEKFADNITFEKIVINNGRHLNAEAGYTELEELLEIIQ